MTAAKSVRLVPSGAGKGRPTSPRRHAAFPTPVTLPPLQYLRSPLPARLIALGARTAFQQVLARFGELKGKSEVVFMLISGSD